MGKCFTRTDGCFVCGNKGHKMRDYPNLKEKGKDYDQTPSFPDPNSSRKNHFFVTGTTKVANQKLESP